jgi:hydrogenase expression/formation protein HypC
VCLAIPGQVVKVLDDANRLAQVDVAGVRRTVNVSLLDSDGDGADALVGQWVLIHVGFALSRIDEREALATLELLAQMGAEYDQELRELTTSAIE